MWRNLTKNELKTVLQIGVNLSAITDRMLSYLYDELVDGTEDYEALKDIIKSIGERQMTDVDEIIAKLDENECLMSITNDKNAENTDKMSDVSVARKELEKILDTAFNGENVNPTDVVLGLRSAITATVPKASTSTTVTRAKINCINDMYTEVSLPVNGGEFVVGIFDVDEAQQAYIDYKYNDTVIDLALAEVKTGEYAETAGLPADNKDIDLYLYSDPHSEEYQRHVRIAYNDVAEALAEEN